MLLFVSIDQMKNYYLEENYNHLGPEMVFQIWSNVFVIENLGSLTYIWMYLWKYLLILFFTLVTRLLVNITIYILAVKRLPEFEGYKSVRYPGSEPPQTPRITPRRLDLPPSFASDWKKIGSKRTEMLMLDKSQWRKQTRKTCQYLPSVEVI